MGNRPTPLRRVIRENDYPELEKVLTQAGKERSAQLINSDFSQDCIMDSCTRAIGNAFYCAVCKNRLDMIPLLLDYGADIYSTGRYGETCLHAAARNNYVDSARLLVSRGLSVQVTDDRGRHPIHSASMTIFNTSDMIKYLLEEAGQRSDINLRDFSEKTPLHVAALLANVEVVETLLGYGADLSVTDKSGNTPLHEASRQRRMGVVQLLLSRGASDTAANHEFLTPRDILHHNVPRNAPS